MATCVSPRAGPRASPRAATKGHSTIFCLPQQQRLRSSGGCSTTAQGSLHLPAPLGNKQKDAPQKPFGRKGSSLAAEVALAELTACLLPNNVMLSVFPKELISWVQAGLQTPCTLGQLCASSFCHPPTGADEAGASQMTQPRGIVPHVLLTQPVPLPGVAEGPSAPSRADNGNTAAAAFRAAEQGHLGVPLPGNLLKAKWVTKNFHPWVFF